MGKICNHWRDMVPNIKENKRTVQILWQHYDKKLGFQQFSPILQNVWEL